jgi:hypothetical protein
LARGALMCSNEDSVPTGVRFKTITGATTPTAGMGEISGDDKVDESRRTGVWMSGCASCVGTHAQERKAMMLAWPSRMTTSLSWNPGDQR